MEAQLAHLFGELPLEQHHTPRASGGRGAARVASFSIQEEELGGSQRSSDAQDRHRHAVTFTSHFSNIEQLADDHVDSPSLGIRWLQRADATEAHSIDAIHREHVQHIRLLSNTESRLSYLVLVALVAITGPSFRHSFVGSCDDANQTAEVEGELSVVRSVQVV